MESLLNTYSDSEKENLLSRANISRNDLSQFIQTNANGAASSNRARWIKFGERN